MSEVFHDKKGYPIRPGDVLKFYHFTAARRRKKHYMYKVCTEDNGRLYAADIYEAVLGMKNPQRCPLSVSIKSDPDVEIIEGYNCQEGEISYEDRPRLKHENQKTTPEELK